jgi:hypothetical protein
MSHFLHRQLRETTGCKPVGSFSSRLKARLITHDYNSNSHAKARRRKGIQKNLCVFAPLRETLR